VPARIAIWLLASAAISAAPNQGPPPPPPAIAKVASQAAAAREEGRLDEAVKLYRQALAVAPRWQQGWWELGTIYYDRDRYPQCSDAFQRFTALNPKMSVGFAFLGLCQFQTKEFGPALGNLEKANELGLPPGQDVTQVAYFHAALLHTKAGNFERALQYCQALSRIKPDDPQTMAVAGIAGLRKPLFPSELAEEDREVARKLGAALFTSGEHAADESLRRFEALVTEYPRVPNLHYNYAAALLANEPDRGIVELKRELEIDPDHIPALVSLSFEYLRRDEANLGKPYAERAAMLAPKNFAARTCFGRALLEREPADLPGAIRELEAAARLAPDSPQVRIALASAYAKAGRASDAARERAAFARLKQLTDKQEVR
jgi:tetratricopeptide (TPR) repeat protein